MHYIDLPLIYSNLGVCPQKLFLNCISISQLNIFWECVQWRRDRVRIVIHWENALSKLCRLQTRLVSANQRPVLQSIDQSEASLSLQCPGCDGSLHENYIFTLSAEKNCKHITLLVYICSQLHSASGYGKQEWIFLAFDYHGLLTNIGALYHEYVES